MKEGASTLIKTPSNPNGNAHRVITFLTRNELDFLDKIGKDALFSAGTKLSRSKIISAIVNVMRRFNIDGTGLHSKRELEEKIIKTITKLNALKKDKNPQDNYSENDNLQEGKSCDVT